MKIFLYLIVFSFLTVSYNNCTPSFESASVGANEFGFGSSPLTKQKIDTRVQSILNKNCASCHNSELNFANISKITDLEWLQTSGMMNAVLNSINTDKMPPSGRKLNISEKNILNSWHKGSKKINYNDLNQCTQVASEKSKANENELWLLSRQEYSNVVNDSLKIDVPGIKTLPDPFVNHRFQKNRDSATMDSFVFSEHARIAEEIAKKFTENINNVKKVLDCQGMSESSLSKSCFDQFVQLTIGRLHRSNIDSSTLNKYFTIFKLSEDQEKPTLKGLESVLFAALISPNFLYKKTIQKSVSEPERNYVIAEDLAFHIYSSIPDDTLLLAAQRGELTDKNLRKEQIMRMLNTSKGKQFFNKYFSDYFEIYFLQSYKPNSSLKAEVKASYIKEFDQFIDQVMTKDRRLSTLFSSNKSSPTRNLASLAYGLSLQKDDEIISHDPNERAGVLTLPAFLLSSSTLIRSAPASITRGVFVREKLLCHELGTPPVLDEPLELEKTPENQQLSARQRFEKSHLTTKNCKSCHSMIDPIGFGLAYYNDFGLLEPTDSATGRPVVRSGYVKYTENSNFNFSDATDLSRKLASSDDVSNCFVEKTYEYLKGTQFNDNNLCSIERFQKQFLENNGDIYSLVVSILNDSERYSIK